MKLRAIELCGEGQALEDIDVVEVMEGTPRPHYLFGKARYEREGRNMSFLGNVNFIPQGNPSIADRNKKYMERPHVNAGDCCFALWNAVHIMAEINGYGSRILRNRILIEPRRLVPPDTELTLEVRAYEKEILTLKGNPWATGEFIGTFYDEQGELLKITAEYCAECNSKI